MAQLATYVDVLNRYYPSTKVFCHGDGSDYEHVHYISGPEIPPQAELDPLKLILTKENVWSEIKEERDRRKFNGVKVAGNWFHSDDTSRIQQIGLMLMGASMPAGIMWKTMTDTFVQMTPTLAQQIFQSVATQDMAIFAKAEYHRAMMQASSNPTTYDFSTGWPPTFGE